MHFSQKVVGVTLSYLGIVRLCVSEIAKLKEHEQLSLQSISNPLDEKNYFQLLSSRVNHDNCVPLNACSRCSLRKPKVFALQILQRYLTKEGRVRSFFHCLYG